MHLLCLFQIMQTTTEIKIFEKFTLYFRKKTCTLQMRAEGLNGLQDGDKKNLFK